MKVFDFIKSKIKLNKVPKQRLLLKQASLLCVTMIMLICVVFAWFAVGKDEATASGLSITMKSNGTLTLSLDYGANFSDTINLLGANQDIIHPNNRIKGNLSMTDITSDGKTFLLPVFTVTETERLPNTEETWDNEPTANVAYISQEITFKTDTKCDIFMGEGTGIITSCQNSEKSLVSNVPENIGNKNANYNFSNDCIVGALRISAVDSKDTLRFVCIPWSNVELVKNADDTCSMYTDEDVSENAGKHFYFSTNYRNEESPIEASNVICGFDGYGFDGTQKIATTEYDENHKAYIATATVNIWIEGCDSETTRVLTGGKFQVAFDFVAKETATQN